MMIRDVTYTPAERTVLWSLCIVGVVGLNTAFLYGLFVRPDLLADAHSNPISAAFIIESLLLMCVFAYLFAKWGVSRLHWGWFIALSLLGSMAFALPIVLLWKKKGRV